MLAVMKRPTAVGYVAGLRNKRALAVRNALIESKIDMRTIWRYHSDKGSEFLAQFDEWMKEFLVKKTTTGGYDSAANGLAENFIQEMECITRCFLHQANAPKDLWPSAAKHANAEVAIAISGIAGPDGGSLDKPVGTVWFGFYINGQNISQKQLIKGDRQAVRIKAIEYALSNTLKLLLI